MNQRSAYTVRYSDFEGTPVELCVTAEHVTHAIEVARADVPSLRLYPNRILSVIRGCS